MNKFFILNVVICFLLIGSANAQQSFYYSKGEKVLLKMNPNSMVIYESDGYNINRIVDSNQLEKTFEIKDKRLGQYSVINLKPNSRSKVSDPSIKYAYGLIKPSGEKVWISPFILVRLKRGLDIASIQKILDKYKIDLIYKEFGKIHIKCSNISDVLALSNKIYESGNAIWSQPDFLINTTRHQNWKKQYYLNNTDHSYCGFDNDIDALEAWNLTLGCNDITVAVIDDGVEDHPALEDGDGNSRVLPGFTPSGITDDGRPAAGDSHGQACAGIIAASHNSEIRGLAPNVNILPVKIRYGVFPASEYADAIDWAWQNGADIISNSWGGTNEDIIIDAINNAQTFGRGGDIEADIPGLGALVTFSTGNEGANEVGAYAQVSIAVGAINKFDGLAESEKLEGRYSNIGPNMDLVAYGGNANEEGNADIRTIDRIGANGYGDGDYIDTFSGTSAACPQVSGVAALVLSINPNLTRLEVENILFNTAVDLGSPGRDDSYGHGKVNAFAAVRSALSTLGETFHENSAQLSLTKARSNARIIFTGRPSCNMTNGIYFCDVYRAQADSGSELEYVRFEGDGLSGANPNNGEYWVDIFLNEDIPGNATSTTSVKTFFYFIKNNLLGQTINQWVPTNPNNSWAKTYYSNPPENTSTNRIVESGQAVNIYATNTITLGPNFHAENGSSLLVKTAILPRDIVCLPNPNGDIVVPPDGGRLGGLSLTDKEILFSSSTKEEIPNASLIIENIAIYPNPSDGNFTVHIPKTDFNKAHIQIQDIRGVAIFKSDIYSTNQNIRFTETSGIYIVKITVDNVIYTERIVLK